MGLGKAFRRAAETRSDIVYTGPDHFTSSEGVTLFGPSTSSGIASTERIESLPAVYRAINLLCGVAQMLPLEARYRKDGSVVEHPNPQIKVLNQPTGDWTWTDVEWRNYELRSRLTRGNSFFLKVGMSPSSPWPSRLLPINPSRVTVAGVWRQGILVDTIYVINNTNKDTFGSWEEVMDANLPALSRKEILHVPGQGFNGVYGISPIEAARRSLSAEALTEDATAAFYKSGSLMSGFLKTDRTLKPEQATLMKERWQQKIAGSANAYEVAVLDGGVTFEPVTVSPADAQWIESRKFNLEQIARVFGVPPFLLMATEAGQSFGTGLDAQLTALQIFTFNEWLIPLEARMTMEVLPSTMVASFKRTELERADIKSLHAAYAIGRQNGYYSINEIRGEIGLALIDDDKANDPMLPPAKSAGAADQPGGNDGEQGGGDEASPDVVNN